ncbi:hypothetical protein GCM10009539_57280 [Cryptosporangium japonicum]|uniref:Uncharacterized protein n=1 Tax=Cryptosporangium japonicum TaxID=80872 RepID=A0ABP3EKB8_9ACTN
MGLHLELDVGPATPGFERLSARKGVRGWDGRRHEEPDGARKPVSDGLPVVTLPPEGVPFEGGGGRGGLKEREERVVISGVCGWFGGAGGYAGSRCEAGVRGAGI